MKFESKYGIGDALEDKVTGFVGVVSEVLFSFDGDVSYRVESPSSAEAITNTLIFTEGRIEATDALDCVEFEEWKQRPSSVQARSNVTDIS